MAAVAAAMVAAASGSSALAGAGVLQAADRQGVSDPILLGERAPDFDGWQVGVNSPWFATDATTVTLQEVLASLGPPVDDGPDRPTVASTAPIVETLGGSGIPDVALRAYVQAEKTLAVSDPSCHVRWSVLAAIGRVESNHGRFGGAQLRADGYGTIPIRGIPLDGRPGVAQILDTDNGVYDGDTTYDRAVGPMQFLPSTWPFVAADGNGDGKADPNNIFDAAIGSARYLCAGDADLSDRAALVAAVLRYNHSDQYVALVLGLAASYESGHAVLPTPGPIKPVPPTAPVLPPPTPPGTPPGLQDVIPSPSTPPKTGGGGPTLSPGPSTRPTSPTISPTPTPPPTDPTTPPTDPTTPPVDPTTPPTDPTTPPVDPTTPPTDPTAPPTSPSPDPTDSEVPGGTPDPTPGQSPDPDPGSSPSTSPEQTPTGTDSPSGTTAVSPTVTPS